MTTQIERAQISPSQLRAALATAQTYAEYAASIPSNRAALDLIYNELNFSDQETSALQTIGRPAKILAIVEEWCPDVIANLPIVARATELNPTLSLHILYRPDHQEIADAYPGPATNRSHIPTYVLFDERDRQLAILIERPAEITEIVKPIAQKIQAEIATQYPGLARNDLPKDFLTAVTAKMLQLRRENQALERAGIARWIVDAISP